MDALQRYSSSLASTWNRQTPVAKTLAVVLAGLTTTSAARMIASYRKWLAMGPGGLRYDFIGYLQVVFVGAMFSQPTRTLNPYDQIQKYVPFWETLSERDKELALKSFLDGELPQRPGPRDKSLPFVFPQRQKLADAYLDPAIRDKYSKGFDVLGEKYASQIEWMTSKLERRGPAMFLRGDKPIPYAAKSIDREVGHIHTSDMTAHILLPFPDAREVVSKGWGERHEMSGGNMLPLSYTLLYVPRSLEEVDTFLKILDAGLKYVTSEV